MFLQKLKKIKNLKNFKLKNLSQYKAEPGVAGLWTREDQFLKAVQTIYKQGQVKPITITPYPVHGLEEASETPRSWIPWFSIVCGVSGFSFGLWFTWWASARSWPILVGGKPFWSLPAFIPIIFELTILFSALGSIAALIWVCGLPHIHPPLIDKDLTCHKFGMFLSEKVCSKKEAKALFLELQAPEVKETEF